MRRVVQILSELGSVEVVVFLLTEQVEQLMHELVMDVEQVVTEVCVVDDVAVRKVSVIYIGVVTVEYKLICIVFPIAMVAYQ